MEKSWYDCLEYPLRAWPLLGGLGFALGLASFGLLQVFRADASVWIFGSIGFVALATMLGFFTCVLHSGARGETQIVRWPGGNLTLLLESLLAALLSFLAGPVIPAIVGCYFWLNSGEIGLIDQLILFELLLICVCYWLLAFASVSTSDRWSDLTPSAVMNCAFLLGQRGMVILAFASGLALFHFWFALEATSSHTSLSGFILLEMYWMSFLYWTTFLLRLLGISLFTAKKATRKEVAE